MSNASDISLYLLAIRGTLSAETLDAARKIHNETAGAPANVAAARSLGDLSHMVHVPIDQPKTTAGEFLILDQWNNLDGLNQFFANPQVQEQAGRIFETRDPVVWVPAQGLISYHFPAPYGKNDRIVGIVRGKVGSHAEAQKTHNALIAGSVNKARLAGSLSHEMYFRLAEPGSAEALEIFGVDVWMDAAAMNEYYEDREFLSGFQTLFAAEPSASTWIHPAGDWVEW